MANKFMPGDYETTVGNESPELSLIMSKQVRGIPLTDAENAALGNPVNIRPRPRPARPQTVNRAKKADKLPIIAKANGGMIDRAAVRGKTKGKIC